MPPLFCLYREPLAWSIYGTPLLILLHGYGSSEADMFGLATLADERFAIVAPRGPITLPNGGYAWTHARFTSEGPVDDQDEAEESRGQLAHFISGMLERRRGYPGGIYLAGFSQGAAMALGLALTQPGIANGVVSMSGTIMPRYMPKDGPGLPLEGLPILISHGTKDRVVPLSLVQNFHAVLERIGATVDYREYAIAHEMSAESLVDAMAWLRDGCFNAADHSK